MLPLLATSLEQAVPLLGASMLHFLPELALTFAACAVLLFDLFLREEDSSLLAWPTTIALVMALLLAIGKIDVLGYQSDFALGTVKEIFLKTITVDPFGSFFKIIFLFGSLLTVVLTFHSRELQGRRMGEYYCLMLCSVVGMCLMATAIDFLMVFIAIELVSLPSYVLVGYRRGHKAGTEASLKYILYGAFSAGVMLFGVSLIYGLTGTTKYAGIAQVIAQAQPGQGLIFSVAALMTFAGFAYKLAAAPFHFWAPDVYQGAPTPITAWLSVTSKAAGIAAFTRFLYAFVGNDMNFGAFNWSTTLLVIAALTMTIGNVQALLQDNVKRMLAYSSIAHVGYILMGMAAIGGQVGEDRIIVNDAGAAVAFYTFAYMWMNLGAFAVVQAVSNRTGSEDLKHFKGLGERATPIAIAMAIYLFAFIGLPPTVGFVAKMQLLMAAVSKGPLGITVAIIAGLNTAVSAYYYMRLMKVIFLDDFGDPAHKENLSVAPGLSVIAVIMALPVLAFGVGFVDFLGAACARLSLTLG